MGYEQDSFYTLGGAERFGLLMLSVLLILAVLLIGWRLMRGQSGVVRLGIAVVLFALFVWLSPQIYYAYYQIIFDGLPAQFVVGWPPFMDMLRVATFTAPSSLSAHGQGVLFWVLMTMALVARGLKRLMSSKMSPQKPQR